MFKSNLSYRSLLSMPLLSGLVWAFFVTSTGLSGCAGSAAHTTSPQEIAVDGSPAVAVAPTVVEATGLERDEPSVHPGINDQYFRPDGPARYTRILEAESREIVRRRIDIVDAIGLREGMAVADIGAGTGLLTTEIAKRVGDSGLVYAVDIVPEFLDLIRRRAEEGGLTNVSVIRGAEKAPGLAPASLDLAFMCDTYHHLEFPKAYMRSLHQALRPGGILVLVDMKRVDGESSPAVLRHVRAGEAAVIAEIEQAGFLLESETDLLRENYYLRFRRP